MTDQKMTEGVVTEEEAEVVEEVEGGKEETLEGIGKVGEEMTNQVMEEAGATGLIIKMPRTKLMTEIENDPAEICELY